MTKNVVITGTLDTKGPEIAYLRDRLHDLGLTTIVADTGILGEPIGIVPDIPHEETATYAGTTLDALRKAGTRGRAVAGMREAVQNLTQKLYADGQLQGAMGMGGAEGAVMGAAAMMGLPVGVPKIMISPIASGHHFFHPLVGISDMILIHSVVDILGLNVIARTIFDNAAAAMAGMLAHGHTLADAERDANAVAMTMLGNTTKAVMAAKELLAEHGYEAVIFHSNGVGGPAMEALARQNLFVGVIDFTTNETYDPMVGGIHDGGPDRLRVIGERGIPQVVVPGCIDFSVWNTGTVPKELAGRPVYDHNPEFILVRASHEEMVQLGHLFAERLNPATGPVRIAIPTQGLSIPNVPDGPFWNPKADADFRQTLQTHLRDDIPVTTYEHHVNDPEFGRAVARQFIDLMEEQPA